MLKIKFDPHDHVKACITFCHVIDKFVMVIGAIDFFGKLKLITGVVTLVIFYSGSYVMTKVKVPNALAE